MAPKYLTSKILNDYCAQAPFLPHSRHEVVYLERLSTAQEQHIGMRSPIPDTRIGRMLAARIEQEWSDGILPAAPLTMSEMRLRAQNLGMLAFEGNTSGFAYPLGLSRAEEQSVTHLETATKRRRLREDDPVAGAFEEMLLLAFEATPRPVSFAMSGYLPGAWLAYMYQDVALAVLDGLSLDDNGRFDDSMSARICEWLQDNRNLKLRHNAESDPTRRHLLQRLSILMERQVTGVRLLFRDQALRPELTVLGRKLLEVEDDEAGFLRGEIRPFEEVRADWNALAEYVMRKRHSKDDAWISRFVRVPCPGRVLALGIPFSDWTIALPVGPRIMTEQERKQKALQAKADKEQRKREKALKAKAKKAQAAKQRSGKAKARARVKAEDQVAAIKDASEAAKSQVQPATDVLKKLDEFL